MGILDNEFVKLVLSGSPYMQSREREQIAQQRGEAFGGLLNQYRVPGDPDQLPLGNTPGELDQTIQRQQGGFKAPNGLLSDQPPPEFFLRAAALPGYEQLAGNAQSQAAAMQRQMQQQGWESENMTLAQKVAADAQAQRDRFSQERQVYEYENPSAYQQSQIGIQRGQLGISQQNAGLEQAKFMADYQPDGQGGYMPRPKPTQLNFQQEQEVRGAVNMFQNAKTALGDLSTIYAAGGGSSLPAWASGERKALQDQYQAALRPIVQKIVMGNRTDAPGEADIKQINEFLGDVTSPWQASKTRQGRITMLERMIEQQYEPYKRFGGDLMYQPGQSPYAQTYGMPAVPASKVGPVKPYQPGAK